MHGAFGLGEKVQHLNVQRFERVADVHNQHQAEQGRARLQIVAQQLDPVCADGFGHLRVAVAGQIDHEMPVAQLEKINVLRAAGCFGNVGQADMVAQCVDCTGFSRIASADKGNFGGGVGQIFQMIDGGKKFCVVK